MGLMRYIRELYDNEEGPTVATGAVAVGISLMFTVGLFLIINAHNSSQSRELAQAVAAIRKSQDEGISLSQALAELKTASALNKGPKVTNNDATFDTLTVKGTSILQGDVNTQKDTNVTGKLRAKNGLAVTGTITKNGVNLDDLYLKNESDDPANSTTINPDEVDTGTLHVSDAATIDGDLTVGGSTELSDLSVDSDASVSGDISVDGSGSVGGDLSVGGLVDTTELTVSDVAEVGALQVDGDVSIGGQLTGDVSVEGALTVGTDGNGSGNINADGNIDAASISIGRTDVNDLFIQASPSTAQNADINITGNITSATLTTTDDVTAGGNLTVVGSGSIGHTYSDGTISQSGTTVTGSSTTFTNDMVGATIYYSDGSSDDITGFTDATHLTVQNSATWAPGTAYEIVWSDGGNLDVANSISIHGNDVNSLFIQNIDPNGPGATPQDANIYISGAISADSLETASNLTVNGDAHVVGDLTVDGSAAISEVSTDTTFDGDATINGALNIAAGGDITVEGNPTVSVVHNSTNDGTQDCSDINHHIRINAISHGLVTATECALNSTGSANYDLAEHFPSTQNLTAGDVVSIDPANAEGVVKSNAANDRMAIGVVSTAPGYTLGQDGPGYPIALAGRVPVKVTNEGGSIAPGDYLTTASTPGYAKKAQPGDKTIGQALEGFSGASGTVKMFISLNKDSQGSVLQPAQNGASSFSSLNVSGPTSLNDLTVSGLATVHNLQINGHVIGNDDTRGSVTVKQGQTTVHHDFATPYDNVPTVVASPSNHAALFNVSATKTGFDITLTSPAADDTTFNYLVEQ